MTDSAAARMAWPKEGYSRIPYGIYTDPDVYAEEQQKLFRGPVWNFVGLEQEIPEAGDYRTIYIGETPVIVVRDNDGDVQVMVNRCAHRGNLVCIAREGNAPELTCVYHNWRYDLKGNLVNVAFGKGVGKVGGMPDDFDPAQFGLHRLRVETLHGLIFATFSEAAPPLRDFLGADMCANMDRVLGRDMELLGTFNQYMPNNWKLYMENVRDSYHASILHMFQATFRINRLSMKGGIKLSDNGWHHISYSIAETDKEEEQYNSKVLLSVKDGYLLSDPSLVASWREYDCGTTLAIQSTYPNFVVQQIYNSIALRLCLPKGPEECELMWWVLGSADDTAEQREARIKQSNMVGPGGLISMEDGVVGGWVQRGSKHDPGETTIVEMGGRDVAPTEEGRATEVSIRGFWKGYRELMGV
jgi:phenylpropionate dioxygenase-like ring-hydroxylating dioxygenase large terminal subunit